MDEGYDSIRYMLEALGYQEVRFDDEEEWRPLQDVDDRLGTTDDTRLTKPGAGEQYARLTDVGTGELLAVARTESPIGGPIGSQKNTDCSENPEINGYSAGELVDLKSKASLPNTRTAAYLLAKSHVEGRGDVDHETLVTSANLAVLKAWNEGLELSNLDAVAFRTVDKGGLALQIEGQNVSVSVSLIERSRSLKEPWDGRYSISAVAEL